MKVLVSRGSERTENIGLHRLGIDCGWSGEVLRHISGLLALKIVLLTKSENLCILFAKEVIILDHKRLQILFITYG